MQITTTLLLPENGAKRIASTNQSSQSRTHAGEGKLIALSHDTPITATLLISHMRARRRKNNKINLVYRLCQLRVLAYLRVDSLMIFFV